MEEALVRTGGLAGASFQRWRQKGQQSGPGELISHPSIGVRPETPLRIACNSWKTFICASKPSQGGRLRSDGGGGGMTPPVSTEA